MEVDNDKLIEPGCSEYGCIRARSSADAIMVRDVMCERLIQGGVHTSLKVFYGINAFNTMTDTHANEFCLGHVYHIAVKDQTMKRATFIQSCDSIALF